MIRRKTNCADGSEGWLLVSQVEHAQLAAELLRHWRFSAAAHFNLVRDEMLSAVLHHDDGWQEWEKHPKVAAETGWPVDFTEMPLAESLQIWRQSIEISARIGALAAYVVSGHFSYLLEQSSAWTAENSDGVMVRKWHDEFADARQEWLADWIGLDRSRHTRRLAESAVRVLQVFDAASLWFCCSGPSAPYSIEAEPDQIVVFAPDGEGHVHVRPWQFVSPALTIEVSGESLPVQRFADSACLARAGKLPARLRWALGPAPLT